jgi:hypothetical protein
MLERLEVIANRFEELNMRLADPGIINDQEQYLKLMKEHTELSGIVEKFREYKAHVQSLEDAKLMLEDNPDKELEEMIQLEIKEDLSKIERAEKELKIMLMPKDPNDEKNVIVEIRGGAGGDEAALFAADLFRMYSHYAESRGWSVGIIDSNPTEIGGFKEIVFEIEGKGAARSLFRGSGRFRPEGIRALWRAGRSRKDGGRIVGPAQRPHPTSTGNGRKKGGALYKGSRTKRESGQDPQGGSFGEIPAERRRSRKAAGAPGKCQYPVKQRQSETQKGQRRTGMPGSRPTCRIAQGSTGKAPFAERTAGKTACRPIE